MRTTIAIATWLVIVGCGGKIAPETEPAAGAPSTSEVVAPEPVVSQPAQEVASVTEPIECAEAESAKSIIATTCTARRECRDDSLANAAEECPCGQYRIKIGREGCVQAVESWTVSAACVARAVLGEHFCAIDPRKTDQCLSLTVPCEK